MSYRITLNIAEDSELGRLIEDVAAREQLSREEAALKLSRSHRNGTELLADEAEQTAQAQRMAAIKAVTGSVQGPGWLWNEFEAERRADIEREDERTKL